MPPLRKRRVEPLKVPQTDSLILTLLSPAVQDAVRGEKAIPYLSMLCGCGFLT
jgi:hypothetical protein